MSTLTTRQRSNFRDRTFGLPDTRQYPMPDKEHAANAKARASEEYNRGHLSKAKEDRIDHKADRKLHGVKEHEQDHWGD